MNCDYPKFVITQHFLHQARSKVTFTHIFFRNYKKLAILDKILNKKKLLLPLVLFNFILS